MEAQVENISVNDWGNLNATQSITGSLSRKEILVPQGRFRLHPWSSVRLQTD
jgi:hypothetical protein